MTEPLYTASEMKEAEAGHDVDELMARAGRAVAEEALRRFPDATRFVAVCGGGANGGDGRVAPAETEHGLVTAAILERVPRRRPDQSKYTAGSVLVVGGSRGLTGAPCLAAEAAFRADAGYVAVAVPDSTLPVFEQRLLEAVKLPCPEDDGKISPRAVDPIVEFAGKAAAVALGPGLGRGPGPKEVVARLLAELETPV